MSSLRTRFRPAVLGAAGLPLAGLLAYSGLTRRADRAVPRTVVSSSGTGAGSGLLDRLLAGHFNCGKITLESATRALKRMEQEGTIRLPRGRIEIRQ